MDFQSRWEYHIKTLVFFFLFGLLFLKREERARSLILRSSLFEDAATGADVAYTLSTQLNSTRALASTNRALLTRRPAL